MSTHCINGRGFIGNSPTIVGRSGQRIRWYVFNLDTSTNWHNFHPHAMRWKFGGEDVDIRSMGPAESFVVEAEIPPVLLLTAEEEKAQDRTQTARRDAAAPQRRLHVPLPRSPSHDERHDWPGARPAEPLAH